MAIVAMPIVIVTSWVLYQRCKCQLYQIGGRNVNDGRLVVLGEERKHLVKPGMVLVDRGEESSSGGSNSTEGSS